jgi:hypothetical protein
MLVSFNRSLEAVCWALDYTKTTKNMSINHINTLMEVVEAGHVSGLVAG